MITPTSVSPDSAESYNGVADRLTREILGAWRPNLDDWLGSLGENRDRVSFDDVRTVVRGDMGFLTAIVTYAAVNPAGETLRSLQDRLTWVLVRGGDGWLIAHQHTSFPTGEGLKAILRRD